MDEPLQRSSCPTQTHEPARGDRVIDTLRNRGGVIAWTAPGSIVIDWDDGTRSRRWHPYEHLTLSHEV